MLKIGVNLFVIEPIRGQVIILRQLADRPHVGGLGVAGEPSRLQELEKLSSECRHKTSLLVIWVSLDKELDEIDATMDSESGKGCSAKKDTESWDRPPCREAAMFNKALVLTAPALCNFGIHARPQRFGGGVCAFLPHRARKRRHNAGVSDTSASDVNHVE